MENTDNSYYECKRCSFQTNYKNDMRRHLNKLTKCTRNFESYKYKDDELNILSLQLVNSKTKSCICIGCNKNYSNKTTLERHIKDFCKNTNNVENLYETYCNNNIKKTIASILPSLNVTNKDINAQININNNPVNIDGDNNNIVVNSIENLFINNNIQINFDSVKDFKEDWDMSKIDNSQKLNLLSSTFKFTNTLKNILENEVNLNVLIDNTTDSGFVYTNNSLEKMDLNDIFKKSMEKIYNHLLDFEKDLVSQVNEQKLDLNDITLKSLKDQIKEAKDKWTDYRRQKDINKNVNAVLKNIYNGKKMETVKSIDKVIEKTKIIHDPINGY